MQKRPRRIVSIDLFPFLSLVLCVTGVQAVILFAQSVILPVAERQAALAHAAETSHLHRIRVTEDSLTMSLGAIPIPWTGEDDNNWKSQLKSGLEAALVAHRTGEHSDRRLLLDIIFDPDAIFKLRGVLEVVDKIRDQGELITGVAPFDIQYRVPRNVR